MSSPAGFACCSCVRPSTAHGHGRVSERDTLMNERVVGRARIDETNEWLVPLVARTNPNPNRARSVSLGSLDPFLHASISSTRLERHSPTTPYRRTGFPVAPRSSAAHAVCRPSGRPFRYTHIRNRLRNVRLRSEKPEQTFRLLSMNPRPSPRRAYRSAVSVTAGTGTDIRVLFARTSGDGRKIYAKYVDKK